MSSGHVPNILLSTRERANGILYTNKYRGAISSLKLDQQNLIGCQFEEFNKLPFASKL